MVLDELLIQLAVVYATCAVLSAAILYWMQPAATRKRQFDRVSKPILRLVAYPVVIVSIVLIHTFACVVALIRYTIAWVGYTPIKSIKVKTTFE